MKSKMLKSLFFLPFFLFWSGCSFHDSYIVFLEEMENEVALSDLVGLDFSTVYDNENNKLGLIFSGFSSVNTSVCNPNSCSYTSRIPSFSNGSILSLQLTDAKKGTTQPLVSYYDSVTVYIKGDTFIPNLENRNKHYKDHISFNGYYQDKQWVEKDTTIALGNMITIDENDMVDFTVSDGYGNRVHVQLTVKTDCRVTDGCFKMELNFTPNTKVYAGEYGNTNRSFINILDIH